MISYLFLEFFFKISVITTFVIVIISSVFDFWTVKNVTGRLLVGLRWCTMVDKDGKDLWIYETIEDDDNTNNNIDTFIFWYSQIVILGIWVFISLFNILTLKLFWVNIY